MNITTIIELSQSLLISLLAIIIFRLEKNLSELKNRINELSKPYYLRENRFTEEESDDYPRS